MIEAKRKFECKCKSCKCDACPTLATKLRTTNCNCATCECGELQKKIEEKITELEEKKATANNHDLNFGTIKPCLCQPKCRCKLCPGREQKPDNKERQESCLCSDDCLCTVCAYRKPKKFPFESVKSCNGLLCICNTCPGLKE